MSAAETSAVDKNYALIFAGILTFFGGLAHLGAIVGGPAWYAFIGAPDGIVEMLRRGHRYPTIVVCVIAAFLLLCSSYAFSGAGLMRRLPLLKTGLFCMSLGFLVRGFGFFPLVYFYPGALSSMTNSKGFDALLIVTSTICLATGFAYALGLRQLWRRARHTAI